jgi:hypothetical protein
MGLWILNNVWYLDELFCEAVFRRGWWKAVSRWQRELRGGGFGMQLNTALKPACMRSAHIREDMQGASRRRGWGKAVMKYRSLRDRVVRR